MMNRPMLRAISLGLALALAVPCALAERNFSAQRPAASAKAVREIALRLHEAPASGIHLVPLDRATVDAILAGNLDPGLRALRVGIVRDIAAGPESDAAALPWRSVEGGAAAQWRVTAEDARALRIELSFRDVPDGVSVRFASASTLDRPYEMRVAGTGALWSPMIAGDEAVVELFAPHGIATSSLAVRVSRVAHHVLDVARNDSSLVRKSSRPQSCEVDVACAAKDDAALARASAAVSRITYIEDGSAWACTGTLLNSADGSFTPYYLTAAHCVGDAASAATVTTLWFDEASSCGSAQGASPVQVAGGARLLFADTTFDGALLRLNEMPPEGAVYAGWDSLPLEPAVAIVGLHYPGGGPMKVSDGVETASSDERYIAASWSRGITEGGSSGSALFTSIESPVRDYLVRGTLVGGSSSCAGSGSSGVDYYSRFDLLWPKLAPFLSGAAPGANHSGIWSKADEPGWGLEISHQQGYIVAVLFGYSTDGAPEWLLGAHLDEKSDGDFSGALYRMRAPSGGASRGSPVAQTAGTMRLVFGSTGAARLEFEADGTYVAKEVTPLTFAASGPAICSFSDEDRSGEANYQDLWTDPDEPAWGLALAHQGDTMFAILFSFDDAGASTWLAAPQLERGPDGRYAGALYRTSGSPVGAVARSFGAAKAGTIALAFSDGATGILSYTVDGRSVRKPIARLAASPSAPACR